jgi:hypothetical protein
VVLLTTEVDIQTDSQVQVITETENERDLRSRRRSVMLSDREVNEMVKYGEVINYSSSEDDKQTRQKTPQETIESDTTGSTPEIFKSPIQELVGTVTTDTETVSDYAIQARSQSKKMYQGIRHVAETELQDESSDDDIPVATLLRQENSVTLIEQQIKDCQEGPQGMRAIGVSVAKVFDGVHGGNDIMGEDFNPLHTIPGRDLDGKFLFTKTVDVPKNHLSLAYLLHAYDVNDSTFKRLRARGGTALPKQVPHIKGQSVLKDKEYSDVIFNARNFFVKSQMRKWLSHNQQASTKRKAERRKWLRSKWDTEKDKDPSFGEAYDKKASNHAKRQEGAKGELVQIMNRNARRSYASLEKAMNNWCSWKTIERFLKSNDE